MLLPPVARRSWLDARVLGSYLGGTTSGALVTGLTIWALSGLAAPLPHVVRVAMVATGALLIWLCELGPLSRWVSLPQAHRQIPAEVFGRGMVRGAFRFGLELGTGVRTYLPSPTPYVLLLTIALGQLALSCALCAALGFGLGRALPLFVQFSATDRQTFAPAFLGGAVQMAPTATTLVVLAGGLSLV